MSQPTCETTGHPILFCDCEVHDPRPVVITPWNRADRSPGTEWLDERQEKRLRDTLRDLPDRYAICDAIKAGEHISDGEDITRSIPGSRPPLNIAILDLTRNQGSHPDPIAHMTVDRGLVAMLESWTRLAEAEMLDDGQEPEPLTTPPTVATECDWLLRNIVWVLEQQWVTELADDLAKADKAVKAALRERPEYLPRCDRCGWRLEAKDGGSWYSCTGCRRVIDHWAELKRLAEIQPPMTIKELATAVDVPMETVKGWVKSGALTAVNDVKRGRLYDVWQARQVKAALRHGPNKETA